VYQIINQEERKLNIETVTWGKLTWFYVEKPSQEEVDYLVQHFPIHPLNLDDILSRVQRPKIDEYSDHLFIILHFPVFDKQHRVTTPSEVDIFINENNLITIHCAADLKPLAQFFKECQTSEAIAQEYMNRSSSYLLYHILDRLVNYCFPILSKITENIEKVEELVFARPAPETVREISLIRRDLISFRRVIRPQIDVIEALEREEYPFFKEEQEIYFGDIADHVRKIWDGLEDSKEVVESLVDTSNWLTSHWIQEVMRVLTIIMAIMMPIEVVASLEGSTCCPNLGFITPCSFIWAYFFNWLSLSACSFSCVGGGGSRLIRQ
jgi:magnesium transporter